MATRMTRCGFCRRLACERTEAGPASRGQEAAPLGSGSLLPDDVLFEETYCRECDRFYQQLITFGPGDECVTDWSKPESPSQTLPQPKVTAGLPV